MKCSFVVGFNISITLFSCILLRTLKSILSNISSSLSSSASSITQVVMPCKDLRFAVWSPELVLIPLNIILLPLPLFIISSFVILNWSITPSSSNFSMNSGMILMLAALSVYRVNNIVWPA